MTYRILLLLIAAGTAAVLTLAGQLADAQHAAYQQHMQALCSTDSDCMRLCDPDDAECDGGPQQ